MNAMVQARWTLPLLAFVGLCAACRSAPPSETAGAEGRRDGNPPRVAIVSGSQAIRELTTTSYRGGFEAKTAVYETLVKRDDAGRISPGLASSWSYSDGGRTLRLELRPGARFHDGSSVDARSVRLHMQRWIGLPEHDWLLASRAIRAVEEDGDGAVVLRIDPPCDVLPDLCAVNPAAITAPGTRDFEGEFATPIGSGPWAWEGVREDGRVIRVVRWNERENKRSTARVIDLVRYEQPDCRILVQDLLAGTIDAIVESWYVKIPRDLVTELVADPTLRFVEGPGSSTVYLYFRLDTGPCADVRVRRAIADAIVREELIDRTEDGHADPTHTWAPPGCADWPASRAESTDGVRPAVDAPVRLLARGDSNGSDQLDLARAIAEQCASAGIDVRVVEARGAAYGEAVRGGLFDVRIETTWGMPYDPDLSLRARFLDPLTYPSATTPPVHGREPRTAELVRDLAVATDQAARVRARDAVQAHLDEQAIVVPLFVPRRIAVVRRGIGGTPLDRDLYRLDTTLLTTNSAPRSMP